MKSHQINNSNVDMTKIESQMQKHLLKQFNLGASYGAKAFCQVIKDKIDNFKGDDFTVLLADISEFANKTLVNSPENLQTAFEQMHERINKIIGKEAINAE